VVVVQGHIVFIPVGECIQVHFLCRRVHSSGGCTGAHRIYSCRRVHSSAFFM